MSPQGSLVCLLDLLPAFRFFLLLFCCGRLLLCDKLYWSSELLSTPPGGPRAQLHPRRP